MLEEVIFYKESFFKKKYSGNKDNITQEINDIIKKDSTGRTVSNVGGYQSNFLNGYFVELIDFIVKSFKDLKLTATLEGMWLNINDGDSFNISHIHRLDEYSCVYYHKVCCDNSPICFSNLIPTIVPEKFCYAPKENEIIFFKGRIPHHVLPCKRKNHQRISIALNFSVDE